MDKSVGIVLFSGLICAATALVSVILVHRARREKEAALGEVADIKTQLLARVSNDIKTPMNVIIGTTALGMEETDNPERMRECLERIHMAGSFLMELLNDLVDMSKIQTGRFRLHLQAVSLDRFMEDIRVMVEPACREKKIAFFTSPEDININIMADPMRMSQLFINLLNNAVKFTPRGGEVSFRICNYATHNDYFSADYVVKDSGIGMSREAQKLLFEPFTQEDEAVAERKSGAGLGLAITRNIVDLMGGTIGVKSELGAGTEVKVHLEVELASVQPKEKAGGQIDADHFGQILNGKRVLLVEDHPLNIEITKYILERQKIEVITAKDGEAALEIFQREGAGFFDAILMDIFMPQMDGLEAVRRLRRMPQPDAAAIPIIAMSANDAPEDVYACREAGMNAHIAKPVEPMLLYRVLCEHLQNPL